MTRFLQLSLAVCVLFGAVGCGKSMLRPNQTQVDAYVAAHPDMSALDKSCIEDGRFEVGMNQETVRLLLGEPKKIEVIQQPWAKQEKWSYRFNREDKIFFMEDKGVVAIEENN